MNANDKGSRIIDAVVHIPNDRVSHGRGLRAQARFDEDAITLASESLIDLIELTGITPASLIFASTTPPYIEGGSCQLLVEIAGLPAATATYELSSTGRDGLAAIRLASALTASGSGPVGVIAAQRRSGDDPAETGDGAVAILIARDGDGAVVTCGATNSEEMRDRWQLAGTPGPKTADPSTVASLGPGRVARRLADDLGDSAGAVRVWLPNAKQASGLERDLGGTGDRARSRCGNLGAAHPLMRLVLGLEVPQTVIGATGGLGDAISTEPLERAGAISSAAEITVGGGREVEGVEIPEFASDFDPYQSAARAWRERGQDLRLEGMRFGETLTYPPPAMPPPGTENEPGEPFRLARQGNVLTWTVDHVYPVARETGIAAVALDDGMRFFGQVVDGETVENGQRVVLVPRRLHDGGGFAQYYWKVAPCL